jgi:hypothetical protein
MNYDRVIEIVVRTSHPELLTGLDLWLHLGLVSDAQVKKIAHQYLSCRLPEPILREDIFAPEIEENEQTPVLTKVNIFSAAWQSLRDELSVRWLLFLGVFLVVLSSGVLAASQWQNFPTFAQYAVLWGYTIVFWLVGLWLGRQENLRITSQTLQNISLLLIPINFWSIDSFRLGSNLIEWVTIGIAFISLTTIAFFWSRLRLAYPVYLIAFLVLSYLHWRLPSYSLIAVYSGAIGVVVCFGLGIVAKRRRSTFSAKKTGWSLVIFALVVLLVRTIFVLKVALVDLGLAIALCGWLLTYSASKSNQSVAENTNSAIEVVAEDGNNESSLTGAIDGGVNAIGMEVDRDELTNIVLAFPDRMLSRIGIGLIFLGWLIPVLYLVLNYIDRSDREWLIIQSSIAGILGIYCFWRTLTRDWRRHDLFLLFIIGLQEVLLFKELIPLQIRQSFTGKAVAISQAQNHPYTIYGVTGFIYIFTWVYIANWLARNDKDKLARCAENMLLFFGIILTYISLPIPACRSINLLLSCLTLFYFAIDRLPYRPNLIYFTHAVSLAALFSHLDWWFPNLPQIIRFYILLAIAILELVMSIFGVNTEYIPANGNYRKIWCGSSWYFGLIFSTISYLYLWNNFNLNINYLISSNNLPTIFTYSVLPWLLVPVTLTFIASQTRQSRRLRAAIGNSDNSVTSSTTSTLTTQPPETTLSNTTNRIPQPLYKIAAICSCIALVAAQTLTIWQPETRIFGIAVAIGLMTLNTRYLVTLEAALLHIGFVLAFVVALLWENFSSPDFSKSIFAAGLTLALWLFRAYIGKNTSNITTLYAKAADIWANILFYLNLSSLVAYYLTVFLWPLTPTLSFILAITIDLLLFNVLGLLNNSPWQGLVTSFILCLAIIYRYRQPINKPAIYKLAYLVAYIIFQANFILGGTRLTLSVANIIVGFIVIFAIDRFCRNSPNYRTLQTLPPFYAALSIFWRLGDFNNYTGWLTIGAAILGIGVAKARFFNNKLTYLSLGLVSLGIYEIFIYEMSKATGGSKADGLTILTVVTAVIALIYRIFVWQWRKRGRDSYFSLSLNTILICAHTHWAIASLLKIFSAAIALETAPKVPTLSYISIGISIILGLYAIVQGRDSHEAENQTHADWWVYVGIVEIIATLVYARFLWVQLSIIDPWRILLISSVALIIYQLPWQSWGWQTKPWHRISLLAPLLSAIVTPYDISYLSLFIVAAFYGRIAYQQKNIRWSYLSLAFFDWGICRLLVEKQLEDPLWYAIVFGLSLLYIAQFDRAFLAKSQRKNRHYLRIVGSSTVCIFALILHQESGIIPSVISLVFTFAGLAFRIRAFLFVGTISFLITAFYQLVVLIFSYSFLKWIIGLGTGIALISIAANFERRREQILNLLQGWFVQLREWQ